MGRLFQIKYRSHEPITFAWRHNIKDSSCNYPGLRSYPLPSDFDIYLSKNHKDYPEEN